MKVTAIDLDAGGTPVVRHASPSGPAAERLRREATTLALARGPGVVELVDSGDDEHGGSWLTTRYVGGGTLPDLARTAGHDVTVRALAQVAGTLADLHERGIVHGRLGGDHVVGGARALLCGFAGAQVAAVDGTVDAAVDTTAFAALVGATCSADDRPSALARAAVAGLTADPPTTDLRAVGEDLRAAVGRTDPGAADVLAPPVRGRVLLPRTPPPSARRRRSGWRRSVDGTGASAPAAHARAGRDAGATAEGAAATGPDAVPPRPTARSRGRRVARSLAVLGCALLLAFAVGSLAGRARPGGGDPAATATTIQPVVGDAGTDGTSGPDGPRLGSTPGGAPGASVASDEQAPEPLDDGATPSEVAVRQPFEEPESTSTTRTSATRPAVAPDSTSATAAPGTEPPSERPAVTDDAPETSTAPAAQANLVSHRGARYRIGDPGDLVVVGDWDCDGSATPTVVRPADGSVWTFDTWAPAGAPVVAEPAGVAPSPASAAVTTGPDGCDQLTVTTTDGRTVVVAAPR